MLLDVRMMNWSVLRRVVYLEDTADNWKRCDYRTMSFKQLLYTTALQFLFYSVIRKREADKQMGGAVGWTAHFQRHDASKTASAVAV
jgi:hypothetical protein